MKIHCLAFSLVISIGAAALSSAQQRPAKPARPPQNNPYIVLYGQPNYQGNVSNYKGPVSNLGPNRVVGSVTIGRGVWELCEGPNFTGRCVTLDKSVPDLLSTHNLRNVGSVRPSSATPPPPQGNPYIVLYGQPNYQGNVSNYKGPVSNLSVNRVVGSVTIGRGVWELCDGPNFTGRCVTLDKSVPDLLSAHNLRNVASVRPAGAQRPQPR